MSQFIDGKICDALSGKTGVVRDPSRVAAKPWHRTIFANPGSADS